MWFPELKSVSVPRLTQMSVQTHSNPPNPLWVLTNCWQKTTLFYFLVWTSSPHIPAITVSTYTHTLVYVIICGRSCVLVQVYNVEKHEKGVRDTTQIPVSPKWPPLRIYRALLTARPLRPSERTILCLFFWQWDLHISGNGPFFYAYTECALSSFCPHWCGEAELQRSLSWNSVLCVQKYVYMWMCICHMRVCVVAKEEAGGLCISRRQDWLVPETETRCEDPTAYCHNNRLFSRQLDFYSDHHMDCMHAKGEGQYL